MPHNPAYDPTDPRYYDEKDLRSEVERWGSRAFKEMAEGNPKATCSDCPLAAIQIEQANGRRLLNPMQILAKSYRGEPID